MATYDGQSSALDAIDDFGDWIGFGSARRQREFESLEAEKARNWSEMMSNTAHQREVADLKAAGLNPVLSATGGQGAATPAASSAHGVAGGNGSNVAATINATANLVGTIKGHRNNSGEGAMKEATKLIGKLVKMLW